MQEYIHLGIVTVITFFFNIPWGYWRGSVKKFSKQWFLAVHLPIPVIIFLRYYFDLGFQLYTYPFLVGAFFLGQYVGARYYKKRKARMVQSES